MKKYIIHIEYTTDNSYWSSDDWKTYVCEDFDDNIVILDDNDRPCFDTGSFWWQEADDIAGELENYYDYESEDESFADYYGGSVSSDKLYDVVDLWQSGDFDEYMEPAFIMGIAKILYPFLNLKLHTVRIDYDTYTIVYNADELYGSLDDLDDWITGYIYDCSLYEIDEEGIARAEAHGIDMENADDLMDYGEVIEGPIPITDTYLYNCEDKLTHFAEYFGVPAEECLLQEV